MMEEPEKSGVKVEVQGDEPGQESEAEAKPAQEQATVPRERFLRLQADFENFRKRTEREREEFVKYANEELMCDLLPIMDNFELALKSTEDEGVRMIYRQTLDTLDRYGLKPIEAVGQCFDPYLHEAMVAEESEEHDDQLVLEEFQRGYYLWDKVIRHSKVRVARNRSCSRESEKEKGDDVDE